MNNDKGHVWTAAIWSALAAGSYLFAITHHRPDVILGWILAADIMLVLLVWSTLGSFIKAVSHRLFA